MNMRKRNKIKHDAMCSEEVSTLGFLKHELYNSCMPYKLYDLVHFYENFA